MADRTVTVRFNADDKSLKDAQDRLEEGNRRLAKTFKDVGLEQKGNASEQKKLRAAVERTYKSQDTMNRFIIRYRRELEELTRQQKAEIAVLQKKGAAVEELTASTAKYERLREQARMRNAQDMVQAQRQETRRRSGGRGGAAGGDGAGSWFKTANREGVSLLGTLNDISFKLFVVTFAAKQAADTLLQAFVVVGEELQMIRFRMDQFSDSTQAFDQIYGIAQKLGVSMKDLSNTFLRFAVVNESVGLTTQQMVDLTGVVAKLGVVGGGSVQEINAGMQQLAQGFASNRLQGDELRSVMENLPFLAVTLSRELDTTISGLREMGAAGLLTAETVAEALLSAGKEVERIMENLPQVTEKSLQRIENAWANIIDTALSTTGTEGLAGALNDFAKALDTVAGTIESNSVPVAAFINSLDEIGETLLYVFGARYGMSLVLAGMDSYKAGVKAAAADNVKFSRTAWLVRGALSGPFITVLAAAAYGFTTWRSEMDKTREAANELADDLDGLNIRLKEMTRAQLNVAQTTARAGLELARNDMMARIQEANEVAADAARSRVATEPPVPGVVGSAAPGADVPIVVSLEEERRTLDRVNAARDEAIQTAARHSRALAKVQEQLRLLAGESATAINQAKEMAKATDKAREAWDKYVQSIKQGRKEYAETVKFFDDFIRRVKGLGEEEVTQMDIFKARRAARGALLSGDYEDAIKLAKEAAKLVDDYQSQGSEVTGPISQMAKSIADIGKLAADLRQQEGVINASKELETVAGVREALEDMFNHDWRLRIQATIVGLPSWMQGEGTDQFTFGPGGEKEGLRSYSTPVDEAEMPVRIKVKTAPADVQKQLDDLGAQTELPTTVRAGANNASYIMWESESTAAGGRTEAAERAR